MELPISLTFDDVLLEPGYTGFLRSDIEATTLLTKKINLKAPLVSAPMDTVTDGAFAIALARCGGIGIVHRNLSVADQAAEVAKVKAEKLLVGAAVGSSPGYEARVDALVEAGADVIVVDSAHGFARHVIEAVRTIVARHDVEVIAGSVATAAGAEALIEAGAAALRVGMGPGSICSTRIISGMGVPQLTAVMETARVAKQHHIPVIADGGINYSGDMVKALAAGASTVMLGRVFAGASESAGESVELPPEQVPQRFQSIVNGAKSYTFKSYRGMGSLGAMKKGMEVSSEDEFHGKSYKANDTLIAEGVEGLVPVVGTVEQIVAQLVGGLHSGLFYTGARTIEELWEVARFTRITQASLTESHPHDLFITEAGKNYM